MRGTRASGRCPSLARPRSVRSCARMQRTARPVALLGLGPTLSPTGPMPAAVRAAASIRAAIERPATRPRPRCAYPSPPVSSACLPAAAAAAAAEAKLAPPGKRLPMTPCSPSETRAAAAAPRRPCRGAIVAAWCIEWLLRPRRTRHPAASTPKTTSKTEIDTLRGILLQVQPLGPCTKQAGMRATETLRRGHHEALYSVKAPDIRQECFGAAGAGHVKQLLAVPVGPCRLSPARRMTDIRGGDAAGLACTRGRRGARPAGPAWDSSDRRANAPILSPCESWYSRACRHSP